jgi:hypothetical protein
MNREAFINMLKLPGVAVQESTATTWTVSQTGAGGLGCSVRRTSRYWLLQDGKVYSWLQLKYGPPEWFMPNPPNMLEPVASTTENTLCI